jgi:hypothetical protein
MVYILGFKAGRLNRREGTNFLDADPTKGAILLQKDDELLHFLWKNRETNEVGEVCRGTIRDTLLYIGLTKPYKGSDLVPGRRDL